METGNRQRLHHWDFSRALYLVLGIPFHAAVAYSLSHEWTVSSPDKSQVLTWLADFIHTFRMPGFFLLAGLFSMMLLDRQGAGLWLKTRLMRLGLPLLFATLLILPVQIVIAAFAASLSGSLPADQLQSHIVNGLTRFGEPWISHLWFLWVLIAYCIGLASLQAGLELLGGRPLRARLEAFVIWVGENRILSLAAFAAICQLAAQAQAQTLIVSASSYYGNAVISYNLYVTYFGLGALVYSSRRLNDLLLRPGPVMALAGVVLVTLSQTPHADLFGHTVNVTAAIIGALLIVGFISSLAQRHFDRPDARVRKLVDASFTIYLFHHPVIMVLAALFLMVDLPPVLEFLIIAVSAGLISCAIHTAVSRNALLTLMFNGVRRKKPQASAPSSTETQPIHAPRPYSLRG